MKRFTAVMLFCLLPLAAILSGCSPGGKATPAAVEKPLKTPFSFDFKTGKADAKFFTQSDTFDSYLSAPPTYAGNTTYPNGQLAAFEKARRRKAREVSRHADELAKGSRKLSSQAGQLRQAYLEFLTAAYKADPKFEGLVKESFARIAQKKTKAAVVDAEFKGLTQTKSDNPFAQAFTEQLRIHKAMELSVVALRDVEEIAGMAAIGLELAEKNDNKQVKAAAKKMDQRMSEFDGLLPLIKKAVQGQEKIDHGLRQLETADYYLAKEANEFMASNMGSVKAAAKKLKARGPITDEDIEFMRSYVKLMEDFQGELERGINGFDRKRLVAVPDESAFAFISIAWAAEPGENYDRAQRILSTPAAAEEPGWLSTGWSAIKTTVRGAKTAAGVTLDVAGTTVRNLTRAGFGIYNGEAPSSWWRDMQENTREIRQNYERGVSGSSTWNTAGEYLEGVEKGAGAAVESGVEKVAGKGWTSWALGGISKTTVGMFTGLGKGIYKLSKTDATNVELVEGAMDVGFSFIGGSKVVIKGSQVPGLMKGLGSQARLAGQQGLNFIRSLANDRSKKAILKEMAEALGRKTLTQAQATALIRNSIELEAKEALAATLREARGKILAEMGRILKEGGKAALTESLAGIKSSLDDLLRAGFARNLSGLRQALNTVGGATAKDYMDNLIGSWADDFIKSAVKEIMTSAPKPSEINGAWAGQMTITAINPVLLDSDKSNDPSAEGCNLDIDLGQLKGKSIPIEWTLNFGEDGQGTLAMAGEGGSATGPATYTNGKMSANIAQQGGALAFSGAFTRDDNGYIAGGGGGTISTKGTWFAKVSWTVAPK